MKYYTSPAGWTFMLNHISAVGPILSRNNKEFYFLIRADAADQYSQVCCETQEKAEEEHKKLLYLLEG